MVADALFAGRRRVKDRLAALDCSVHFVSTLANISKHRLHDWLSGTIQLTREEENRVLETTAKLLEYGEAVKPYKLPLDDAQVCKALFKFYELEQITAERLRSVVAPIGGTIVV